jgi:hypothetical protein
MGEINVGQTPAEKLSENCKKIESHLRNALLFEAYLLKTLHYGLEHGVENSYYFDSADDTLFCEHEIGTATEVETPESIEIASRINRYLPRTRFLSMIHNHPASVAPCLYDYLLFLGYDSVENMAVCGHNGNLYFVQKTDELFRDSDRSLGWLQDKMIKKVLEIMVLVTEEKGYASVDSVALETADIEMELEHLIQERVFSDFCEEADGLLCISYEGLCENA